MHEPWLVRFSVRRISGGEWLVSLSNHVRHRRWTILIHSADSAEEADAYHRQTLALVSQLLAKQ